MRSKIGTKSRLAAHILALVLLIWMLVYLAPASPVSEGIRARAAGRAQAGTASASKPAAATAAAATAAKEEAPLARHAPPGKTETLDRVLTPAVATRFPESGLRPPGSGQEGFVAAPETPAPTITAKGPGYSETLSDAPENAGEPAPAAESLRPPAPAENKEPAPNDQPSEATAVSDAVAPAVPPAEAKPESPVVSPEPAADPVAPSGDGDGHVLTGLRPHTADAGLAAEAAAPAEAATAKDGQVEELAPFATHEDVQGAADGEEAKTPAEEKAPEDTPAQPAEPTVPTPAPDAPAEKAAPGEQPSAGALPAATQPDESGSLVVAAAETGQFKPIAATTPLPNAKLEVLGDGVYWLDPAHDLEKELAAIPEIGTLVLLTPIPGYKVNGFDHVKTETIPADASDLNDDSAERFLHETSEVKRPVVIAPITGARGAAFFKGAYLLANRNLTVDEVLREISHELEQAGEARDEIVHRLLRTPKPERE